MATKKMATVRERSDDSQASSSSSTTGSDAASYEVLSSSVRVRHGTTQPLPAGSPQVQQILNPEVREQIVKQAEAEMKRALETADSRVWTIRSRLR